VTAQADRLQIAVSTPLLADIVQNVSGERADVFSVMPENADPHTWEASPQDIVRVTEADTFVSIGANLEPFVDSGGWRRAVIDGGVTQLIVAEAATLAAMYPDRFWVALGTGQASNEHITGQKWPIKSERNARLRECVDIIRALWAGDTVTHNGRVTVEEAKVWSLPETLPMIVGPALSEATAEFVGSWADTFITVAAPRPQLQRMIDAFRRGGGEGKPIYLQSHISWAATESEARANAFEQWRTPIFAGEVNESLRTPAQFDAAARFVHPDELDDFIRISADLERQREYIHEDLAMGFERVYIHNVGRNQQAFIDVFGERLLPGFA